jgi:hypothetical protein
LAIPRIGSGIDKLKWVRVEDVIREVLAGSGVTIIVVSLPSTCVSEVQLTSRGTSLTILCVLNGREVEGVVDTAAQITVMSGDFYKSLQNPPELETSLTIKGAGRDSYMEAFLTKDNNLQVGGQSYQFDIGVAPITDSLLLGLDFLAEHGSIINLEEETLKMGGASSATKMEYKRTSRRGVFIRKVVIPKRLKVQPNMG